MLSGGASGALDSAGIPRCLRSVRRVRLVPVNSCSDRNAPTRSRSFVEGVGLEEPLEAFLRSSAASFFSC